MEKETSSHCCMRPGRTLLPPEEYQAELLNDLPFDGAGERAHPLHEKSPLPVALVAVVHQRLPLLKPGIARGDFHPSIVAHGFAKKPTCMARVVRFMVTIMSEQSYREWLASKHAEVGISADQLAPFVEATCGHRLGANKFIPIVAGHSSNVFEVSLPGQAVIVRAKMAEQQSYAAEQWARHQCHQVGVPAAQIMEVHHLQQPDGRWLSVCIERKCSGRPLAEIFAEQGADSPASQALGEQVGHLVARLHSVQPTGFGPLDGAGVGRQETFAAHVQDAAARSAENLMRQPGLDLSIIVDVHHLLRDNASVLEPSRPSVLHGDCGPDHWFVDAGHVVGLIDLEGVQGGDPVLDFAWWDYWRDWRLPYAPTEALVRGYGRDDLLQPESLAPRLRMARLLIGLTTLDYWVSSQRAKESQQAFDLLKADLRAWGAKQATLGAVFVNPDGG